MRILKFIFNLFSKKNKIDYLIQVTNKSKLRFMVREIVDIFNRNQINRRSEAVSRYFQPPNIDLLNHLKTQGWVKLPTNFASELKKNVIEEVEKLEKIYLSDGVAKVRYKSMWQYLTDCQTLRLDETNSLVQLALDGEILAIVSAYLKSIPWLRDVMITKSIYVSNKNSFSQKWHLDYDDVKMLKLFVYLSDVNDIGDGPFTVLNLQCSKDFKNTFIPSHLDDDIFYKYTNINKTIPIYGKKFSMFLVDTSKLYHQGSRLFQGRSRILYTALYTVYPSIYNYAIRNKSIQVSKNASVRDSMIISPETHS